MTTTFETKLAAIENIGKTLPPTCHETVFNFIKERTKRYTATEGERLINLRDLEHNVVDELYTYLKTFDENRKRKGIWQDFKL